MTWIHTCTAHTWYTLAALTKREKSKQAVSFRKEHRRKHYVYKQAKRVKGTKRAHSIFLFHPKQENKRVCIQPTAPREIVLLEKTRGIGKRLLVLMPLSENLSRHTK